MADPVTPPPEGKWYDPFVNLALKGAEIYGKIQEVKASSKPNNYTVYRPEEVNQTTGRPYGVQATGSAGVTQPGAMPPWLFPVAIGVGVLVLVLALLPSLRRGKGD
jgi:hypothetical protein